jgi:hypothetical protein
MSRGLSPGSSGTISITCLQPLQTSCMPKTHPIML